MTPLRFVFGEDLFLSYSRSDSTAYAAALASELSSRGFSCFLDQWDTAPGQEIPPKVLRSLDRSSMLVLVGSPGAARSAAVEREVRRFLETGRPIVPISVGGSLEASDWFPVVAGASLSVETPEALADGEPSPGVLNRIESSFRFTRRNQRVRRTFLAAALGLLALIGVAGWQTTIAIERTEEARRQTEIAEERLRRARSAELAASSRAQLAAEPDLAALLAVASLETADTFEARRALLAAITERPRLEAVLRGPATVAESPDRGAVTELRFHRDGSRVAATFADRRITVWSLEERPSRGEILAASDGLDLTAIDDEFRWVAGVDRDGGRVYVRPASGTGATTGFAIPADQEITTLALDPDGRRIALGGSDGRVSLWDARSGERVGEILTASTSGLVVDEPAARRAPVLALWFDRAGERLHWMLRSSARGAAAASDGRPEEPLPDSTPAGTAAWSADQKTFLRGSLSELQWGGSRMAVRSRSLPSSTGTWCPCQRSWTSG